MSAESVLDVDWLRSIGGVRLVAVDLHRLYAADRPILTMDPSLTRTGFALAQRVEGDIPGFVLLDIWAESPPAGVVGVERLAWWRSRVSALLQDAAPERLIVEGYAYGMANRAHDLGELGGVLRLAAYDAAVATYVVPPSTARSMLGLPMGKTEAHQRLMVMMVEEGWMYGNATKAFLRRHEDALDAAVLARLALLYHPELGGRVSQVIWPIRARARPRGATRRRALIGETGFTVDKQPG